MIRTENPLQTAETTIKQIVSSENLSHALQYDFITDKSVELFPQSEDKHFLSTLSVENRLYGEELLCAGIQIAIVQKVLDLGIALKSLQFMTRDKLTLIACLEVEDIERILSVGMDETERELRQIMSVLSVFKALEYIEAGISKETIINLATIGIPIRLLSKNTREQLSVMPYLQPSDIEIILASSSQ